MTKFNPENKEILTYGDCLSLAMHITDQADADQYKAEYIKYQSQFSNDKYTPEQVVNINLGYYAGYYSNEVRERVERLFKCSHPVFGSVQSNGIPTGKEAFECGKQGKTLRQIRDQS